MKKNKILILVLLPICFSLASCDEEQEKCPCGVITSKTTFIDESYTDYQISVTNECSNNSENFYLTDGDIANKIVGDRYCVESINSW